MLEAFPSLLNWRKGIRAKNRPTQLPAEKHKVKMHTNFLHDGTAKTLDDRAKSFVEIC